MLYEVITSKPFAAKKNGAWSLQRVSAASHDTSTGASVTAVVAVLAPAQVEPARGTVVGWSYNFV